jgi:hypothetical protein
MINNIFRFDISVDNLVFMHIVQCSANLLDYGFCHFFWQFTFFLQKCVELTRVTELKHEVDIFFVREEGIHFDYVWVIQKVLNLYLADQLDYELAIDVRFVDHFNGAQKS